MSENKQHNKKLFIGKYFLPIGLTLVIFFVLSFFFPALYGIGLIFFAVFYALIIADFFLLKVIGKPPIVKRISPERLSNGDKNMIHISILNRMPYRLFARIYDDLPMQFQERDFKIDKTLPSGKKVTLTYSLQPTTRGEYNFGNIHLFLSTSLNLITMRFSVTQEEMLPTYPSFLHMRKYRLLSEGRLREVGSKQMRRLGNSLEFEQIKEYVLGDDIRSINWTATARKGDIMVNHYIEERAQQVYCIIDKGRLMKSPFKNLSLLDYSINSALTIADVSLRKQDKAGLITFSDKVDDVLIADGRATQANRIMEALYKTETKYAESNFENLYMQVRARIQQRSFLILYTNFETINGLTRNIKSLVSLSRYHLLMIVIFENSELVQLSRTKAESVEDIYIRTIAEKYVYEKKMILKELHKHGIHAMLVEPEHLKVQMLNKYLEFKNRQAV